MIKKKYKLKPLFKHQLLVTGISVFAVVTVALGSSYAIFSKTKSGNEYNLIQVGKLQLSYVDLTDEGNVLSLNSSYPVSDSVGSSGSSYRFSIENVGSVPAEYKIVIVDDADVITSDGCNNKQLDKKYIRYKFDNGIIGTLSEVFDEALGGYFMFSNNLLSGESDIHEIRFWIDGTSPNSVIGEHFHGKVNVVIEQTKEDETPISSGM